MPMPSELRMNAFTGDQGEAPPDASPVGKHALRWALGKPPAQETDLKPAAAPDLTQWQDPRVGYGVILPETDGLTDEQLKTGSDAPEPIVELLKKRPGTAVLRYRPTFDPQHRVAFLRNWAAGSDVSIDRPPVGTGAGQLPSYLLMVAPPGEKEGQIPWDFQYTLNSSRWVGRLDLEGDALENYVSHLIDGWSDSKTDVNKSVFWAVDHGGGDITTLMRQSITAMLVNQFRADDDLKDGVVYLDGNEDRIENADLIKALDENKPAFILTTSHGKTGPESDPAKMAADLGVPVDQRFKTLNLDDLVSDWNPDGAIWYCHACCSAGADGESIYSDLFENGSSVRETLDSVASLGAMTAPMPKRLLGASKPLRAFVGQVEPTFDWTLRNPESPAHLTEPLRLALYERLYQPQGIGLALQTVFSGIGTLYSLWEAAKRDRADGADNAHLLLYLHLAARDLQSTVILGDPTAILPDLAAT